MTTRIDYCNALLAGCPASSINKLQLVPVEWSRNEAEMKVLKKEVQEYEHPLVF